MNTKTHFISTIYEKALWPLTSIDTAALNVIGRLFALINRLWQIISPLANKFTVALDSLISARSRKPSIMGDAAYVLLTKPKDFT